MAEIYQYYDVQLADSDKALAYGFLSQKAAYHWIEDMHTSFGLEYDDLKVVNTGIKAFLDCGCTIEKGAFLMCKYQVMQNASH
jgi:hypothetical protein